MQSRAITKKDTISENSIARVRYHLYQNYILGTPGHQREFDANFRETIKLAIKQLCENLPLYLDRVHNEYHILFQLINESIEGGRNILMVPEIKRCSEFKNAFNIWRERMPHDCESILVWQEILENRNFILQKLRDIINDQNRAQGIPREQLTRAQEEDQIDIVWNNLKMAEISRKHELPQLANHYLNAVKDVVLDEKTKGEALKLERFKYMYETFKLTTKYQTDSTKLKETLIQACEFSKNPDFDLWMHADILRLEGEYALAKGQLKNAKEKLLHSINKNKKEAKTWIAYGRLNELIFKEGQESLVYDEKEQALPEPMDTTGFEALGGMKPAERSVEMKDEGESGNLRVNEKSIQNAFKGYFCGLILNQCKSRFIVPHILNLLKSKSQ